MEQQLLFSDSDSISLAEPDLATYDFIICLISGGKDSTACLLHLLDRGVDRARIELWHHDVDGNAEAFMDWPVTADYCRKLAQAFGLRYYASWREGGFLTEMSRDDWPTAPVVAQTPGGLVRCGGNGPANTRRKFPQVTASLAQRWCSAALKIDVGAAAIRNQARFLGKRTLVVSGERAQESAARAKYHAFEADRTHTLSRHVDHWRPVLHWDEQAVWEIARRYGVRPHPAYYVGFGRVSCMHCIFADANQRATERKIAPSRFARIAALEAEYGITIARKKSVSQMADEGTAYQFDDRDAAMAMSEEYREAILLPSANWRLPAGAYAHGCGPT